MADNISDDEKRALEGIKTFAGTFVSGSISEAVLVSEQKENNLNQVNKLLSSIFGNSDHELVAKKNDAFENSTKLVTPSYNTRTPYVEIYINGIQFIPNANNRTENVNDKSVETAAELEFIQNIEVEFENLELEMPFGGVGSTITGRVTLFTRDTMELLSFITDFPLALATGTDTAMPTLDMKIGWSYAVGSEPKVVTSPLLEFLIMDVAMSDPGRGQGTTVTLTLQDAGSASLKLSSADVGIKPNYPQEQIRYIVEGLLGIRLFTLDDLLYLGNNNKEIIGATPLPKEIDYQKILDSLTTISNNNVTNQEKNARYRELLKKLQTATDPKKEYINDEFISSFVVGGERDAKVDLAKNAVLKVQGYMSKQPAPTINPIDNQQTFFVNEENASFRIHGNTIEKALEELLTRVQCRWYSVSNKVLSDEVSKVTTEAQLFEFKQKFDKSATEEEKGVNEKELSDALQRVTSNCSLIWIPYFPPNIRTSSGTYYITEAELKESHGAYLMLPQPMLDVNISKVNLPMIYGAGGSSFPYFFAGGQNVLHTNQKQITPQMYGEVLDLSIQHSNLLSMMRMNMDENTLYSMAGDRLAAQNMRKSTMSEAAKEKAKEERNKELKKQQPKILEKFEKEHGILKEKLKTFRVSGQAGRCNFKNVIGPKKIEFGDKFVPGARASGKDRTYHNPTKVADHALDKLHNRVSLFLNYPTALGMTVMGDPFLLRQGIGGFELINYYPDKLGKFMKYNYLVSGVYMPQRIVHKIGMGEYITEIQALKVPYQTADALSTSTIAPVASTNDDKSSDAYLKAQENMLSALTLDLENNAVPAPIINVPVTTEDSTEEEKNAAKNAAASQAYFAKNPTLNGSFLTDVLTKKLEKTTLLASQTEVLNQQK